MNAHHLAGRFDGKAGIRARGVAVLALFALGACASGHYPALPAANEYSQSCPELIDAYAKADEDYQDRKIALRAADASITAGAVIMAAASSTAAGVPIALGGFALTQLKGDLGAGDKAKGRDTLHQIAVRNGCTAEDVNVRKAELKSEGQSPAASSAAK